MTPDAELFALLPLALAAGLDLYVTLAFLGLAPGLGWELPPGGLADLGAPVVVLGAGLLWVVELWIDRLPGAAVFWNVLHTVVRPLSAALLAILLLEAAPPAIAVSAAVGAAGVALATHTARTGWDLLLWMEGAPARLRLLASIASDVIALALVTLAVDDPRTGTLLAVAMILLGRLGMGPYLEAGIFGHRLVLGRLRTLLREGGWRPADDFPPWVAQRFDPQGIGPGGSLRGTPAGGLWMSRDRIFRSGWVVVRSGAPRFVYRDRRGSHALELRGATGPGIDRDGLWDRARGVGPEGTGDALFPRDGPGPDGLGAELGP